MAMDGMMCSRVQCEPEPCGEGRTPVQVAFLRYDKEWLTLEEEVQQLVERLTPALGVEGPVAVRGPEPTMRAVSGSSDLVQHVDRKAETVAAMASRLRAVRVRLEV